MYSKEPITKAVRHAVMMFHEARSDLQAYKAFAVRIRIFSSNEESRTCPKVVGDMRVQPYSLLSLSASTADAAVSTDRDVDGFSKSMYLTHAFKTPDSLAACRIEAKRVISPGSEVCIFSLNSRKALVLMPRT